MAQTMLVMVGREVVEVTMPGPEASALGALPWGRFDDLCTPAYWHGQVRQAMLLGHYRKIRLGDDLREEVAACLLGGYGIPAEVGVAAYRRLRRHGLLRGEASAAALEENLAEPLRLGSRIVRYRFARQKARYLAGCLRALAAFAEPACDVALRDALTRLPGIGLKTASWIVRNHRGSDSVAVLDVHVLRAGRLLGLFGDDAASLRDYRGSEARFLAFADAIRVPASVLDAVIWSQMRLLAPVLASGTRERETAPVSARAA